MYNEDNQITFDEIINEENKKVEKELLKMSEKVARKNNIIEQLCFPKASQKEMAVITHAKKLGEYIFIITEKSPIKFRWNLISRLQNMSLQIVEQLYQANFDNEKRLYYQTKASVSINLLAYLAETTMTMKGITKHQMEVIAKQIFELKKLLLGWIKSTKRK